MKKMKMENLWNHLPRKKRVKKYTNESIFDLHLKALKKNKIFIKTADIIDLNSYARKFMTWIFLNTNTT